MKLHAVSVNGVAHWACDGGRFALCDAPAIGDGTKAESACSSCARIYNALTVMRRLSPEERKSVVVQFCRECLRDDPRCQCWNDE